MNYTQNFNLNQWEAGDRVLRSDFNADNAKLDAALKAQAEALEAKTSKLQTELAGKGNCRMVSGSYIGTGNGPKSLYVGSPLPKLIVVVGEAYYAMFIPGNTQSTVVMPVRPESLVVTWTATELSWQYYSTPNSSPLNREGFTYSYFLFY